MKVLALDLALSTGVAFDSAIAGVPTTALVRMPSPPGTRDDGYAFGPVMSFWHRELCRLIRDTTPDLIVYEAPLDPRRVQSNNNKIFLAFGLAAYVEGTAHEFDIACEQVNVRTVKVYFTGMAEAGKDTMIARCRQLRWPTGEDDNRADAAAVWGYAKSMHERNWSPAVGRLL